MDGSHFYCAMCDYASPCGNDIQKHYIRKHKNDRNFFIKCLKCKFQTKSYVSWKTHLSRRHKQRVDIDFSRSGGAQDELQNPIINDAAESIKQSCGKFALRMITQNRIPASTVDEIISSTANLINQANEMENKEGCQGLIDGLNELKSESRRIKFFKENMNYTPPRKVFMGFSYKRRKGKMAKVSEFGYVAPVKDLLRQYLNKQDVYDEISKGSEVNKDLMSDFADGEYMRSNEFIERHKKCLQFAFYTDSVEICSGLSAHSAKVDTFYFSILNVGKRYRTQWSGIHVYAICKTEFIQKHGYERIMSDFVNTMMELYEGLPMYICGRNETIYGMLVAVQADYPAMANLAGIKTCSIKAKKICKSCTASYRDLQYKLSVEDLEARCPALHLQRCKELEKMSPKLRTDWGKRWGITSTSVFLKLPYLELSTQFVFDIMHGLFLGVLPQASALIIQRGLNEKYFTLPWLNSVLAGFRYSYLDTDKPEVIKRQHVFEKVCLKNTAAANKNLNYILPLCLHDKFPAHDEYYRLFLNLTSLCTVAASPFANHDSAGQLQALVEHYLAVFKILYPRIPLKPKDHFLLHLPEQVFELK